MNKVDLNSDSVLEQAVDVLRNGGIVMHPTETCYGLAVDIFNEKAVKKLYKVKDMPKDKPISVLVSSFDMAYKYGYFSKKAKELAEKYWPGPLSIIVPRREELPEFFCPKEASISFRYSDNEFSQRMVDNLGRPVTTTSANKSGESQLYDSALISEYPGLVDGVDLLVDAGNIPENPPSTIIKFDGDKVVVIRQGALEV